MHAEPDTLRGAAIRDGRAALSLFRISDRERAVLTLNQICNDDDGHRYRVWRRVGNASRVAVYVVETILIALLCALVSIPGGVLVAAGVAVGEFSSQLTLRAWLR